MKTKLTMKLNSIKSKSMGPFAFHPNHITHLDTGQKLPLIRIVAKIVDPTSVGAVVEFRDASSRLRREALSWTEYENWSKFRNKIMSFGYRCDHPNLLKSLHRYYLEQDIPATIELSPAGGWYQEGNKLFF